MYGSAPPVARFPTGLAQLVDLTLAAKGLHRSVDAGQSDSAAALTQVGVDLLRGQELLVSGQGLKDGPLCFGHGSRPMMMYISTAPVTVRTIVGADEWSACASGSTSLAPM